MHSVESVEWYWYWCFFGIGCTSCDFIPCGYILH